MTFFFLNVSVQRGGLLWSAPFRRNLETSPSAPTTCSPAGVRSWGSKKISVMLCLELKMKISRSLFSLKQSTLWLWQHINVNFFTTRKSEPSHTDFPNMTDAINSWPALFVLQVRLWHGRQLNDRHVHWS